MLNEEERKQLANILKTPLARVREIEASAKALAVRVMGMQDETGLLEDIITAVRLIPKEEILVDVEASNNAAIIGLPVHLGTRVVVLTTALALEGLQARRIYHLVHGPRLVLKEETE